MRVLVSYDISNHRMRRQVTKVCEAFGQRVQKSVFECTLNPKQLSTMQERLDAARKEPGTLSDDSIRIYPLCADCTSRMVVLGYQPVTASSEKAIIIG